MPNALWTYSSSSATSIIEPERIPLHICQSMMIADESSDTYDVHVSYVARATEKASYEVILANHRWARQRKAPAENLDARPRRICANRERWEG